MTERINIPMNILCKTKYLLSLPFLLFLLIGSHARPLFSSFSYHQGGHASRENLSVLSNAKPIQAVASNNGTMQTNFEERLMHAKPTSKNVPDHNKYNSVMKVSSKSIHSIPRNLSRNEGRKQVHDGSMTKVSSKSMPSALRKLSGNGGHEQVHRRRLRRPKDIDAFVAYADYREPRHHPPKNN